MYIRKATTLTQPRRLRIPSGLDVQRQAAERGLFWVQLADRGKVMKDLNTPKLGDSLLKSMEARDGHLARSAPKLNWDDLTQIPALPLGSWLKTDPWDDRFTC